MQEGRLFVLSGPSGAGKGTICNELVKLENTKLSISMTTRAIRGKEIPNVSYYYVTDEEFDKTIAEGGFLEYAGIYSKRYGTPKKPVLDNMANGNDVILEIEMQGAQQVKRNYEDAILIFVLPPSLKVLLERLKGRGTETPEQIEERSRTTIEEIHKIADYDYYVINDNLDEAVNIVTAIMRAEHGNTEYIEIAKKNRVDDNAIEMIKKYDQEANNAFISINR